MFMYPRNNSTLFITGGLLVGLSLAWLATPASAKQGTGPKREPQRLSNMQLREAHQVLQATKKMLEAADHDYGGHRVDAIKAINAAEQQLRLALGSRHKKTGPSGKAGGKPGAGGRGKQPEPQNISNLQLADAIVILERTQTLLANANHDYGGHRAAAVRDLGIAVKQLKIALKYEKKVK